MVFRQARASEIEGLLAEGYKYWSRNRTFDQYCADNRREDVNGIRYVIEENGDIVSSLILLKLNDFKGKKVFGIGSVLTPEHHSGKGYATILLKNTINTVCRDALIFLYSDISPEFYRRFGFRPLPDRYQKKENSVCMLRCTQDIWGELEAIAGVNVPGYF